MNSNIPKLNSSGCRLKSLTVYWMHCEIIHASISSWPTGVELCNGREAQVVRGFIGHPPADRAHRIVKQSGLRWVPSRLHLMHHKYSLRLPCTTPRRTLSLSIHSPTGRHESRRATVSRSRLQRARQHDCLLVDQTVENRSWIMLMFA